MNTPQLLAAFIASRVNISVTIFHTARPIGYTVTAMVDGMLIIASIDSSLSIATLLAEGCEPFRIRCDDASFTKIANWFRYQRVYKPEYTDPDALRYAYTEKSTASYRHKFTTSVKSGFDQPDIHYNNEN